MSEVPSPGEKEEMGDNRSLDIKINGEELTYTLYEMNQGPIVRQRSLGCTAVYDQRVYGRSRIVGIGDSEMDAVLNLRQQILALKEEHEPRG